MAVGVNRIELRIDCLSLAVVLSGEGRLLTGPATAFSDQCTNVRTTAAFTAICSTVGRRFFL
jgi:hypothetical protein